MFYTRRVGNKIGKKVWRGYQGINEVKIVQAPKRHALTSQL